MTTKRPGWLRTPAELAKVPLPSPLRQLTVQEGEDLVHRLNVKASRTVAAEEFAFLAEQPPIRYEAAVERVWGQLQRELQKQPHDQFLRGARDALLWAYGHSQAGPVSGEPAKHQPPRWSDLYREDGIASDALAGRLDHPPQLPRAYITGVEHALLWLQCATDDPPAGPLR